MRKFHKPAISPDEQLLLLEKRGLVVRDHQRALAFLQSVSFFRLTPYMRPFQTNNLHTFKSGTSFRDLVQLYDFDRRLRLIVMGAIERTEVAIRAHIKS